VKSIAVEPPLAEIRAPAAEAFVALAETIVHTPEATVKATKSTAVEATESAPVETSAPAPAETSAPAPVETSAPASVETPAAPAAAMPGVGEIWLAQRGSAQQSGCGCQRPSYPWPGSMFA
jgi:hypothetical protein